MAFNPRSFARSFFAAIGAIVAVLIFLLSTQTGNGSNVTTAQSKNPNSTSWNLSKFFPVLPPLSYSPKLKSSTLPELSLFAGLTRQSNPGTLTSNTASVTFLGQSAGPTPFIAQVNLTVSDVNALDSIRFTITPKPGSVTRPLSVTYVRDYLVSQGYLVTQTGDLTLPVFGLYANYSNTVTLTYSFVDGSSQQDIITVSTAAFTDACSYNNPTVLQARTNNTDLSYDFILVKSACSGNSPTILDTDGQPRWVGTANIALFSSGFFNNGIYIGKGPVLTRIEFDGSFKPVIDYTSTGITNIHHNIDPGKYGMILDVDTTSQIESVVIEVDPSGNILKRWDLADIISAAMTAGGDDPTQFVKPAPTDWFHNNAVTYRKSDDSLIVSSREDFVICLDYETGAIKWILGDNTKKWYQFQSLRNYALSLAPGSLPPIGQHAVSITYDDNLLLFDNGRNSQFQTPLGTNRTYSSPRKYQIDTINKIATEVWNYPRNQSTDSQFCGSTYEDAPLNYLVDYAIGGEILGLSASGELVFDYVFPTTGCDKAFNSIPIHLERLTLTNVLPNALRITNIVHDGTSCVVSFPAIGGTTYRLEYKDTTIDPTWLMAGDNTPAQSGTAQITDPSAGGHPRRFYRVRQLVPSDLSLSVNDSVTGTGNNQWDFDDSELYKANG